jgi:integrase
MPVMWFPPKPEGRERWLTRSEVARLLWAARRSPHLSRFIIVAYYTGTRSGAVLALQWSWIDLRAGVMRRRAPGEAELATKRRPPVRLGERLLSHLRRWRRLDHGIIKHRGAWIERKGIGEHRSTMACRPKEGWPG